LEVGASKNGEQIDIAKLVELSSHRIPPMLLSHEAKRLVDFVGRFQLRNARIADR
jgi:hypothetical protein